MAAAVVKGLMGVGAIAAMPVTVAYIFTADHSTIPFGTHASNSVENRFKVFDDRAKDSLPAHERRHARQKVREALMAGEVAGTPRQ